MQRLLRQAKRLKGLPWYLWPIVILMPGGWLILVYYMFDKRRK